MSQTETQPIPTPLAFIYVLSGFLLVVAIYAAVWEYTGLVGVLALTEMSVIVAIICRKSIIGDLL